MLIDDRRTLRRGQRPEGRLEVQGEQHENVDDNDEDDDEGAWDNVDSSDGRSDDFDLGNPDGNGMIAKAEAPAVAVTTNTTSLDAMADDSLS